MSQRLFRLLFSKSLFSAAFFSFLLLGCVGTSPLVPPKNLTQLSTLLESLDDTISQPESMHLARDIFGYTGKLRKEFKMTSPPLWHNFLVNVGIRKKGLCYHWSDALYVYLSQKNYPSFEFHLFGANIGEYLFEHNVLVVIEKGGKVEEGIIIDPWRTSGKLYFSKVEDDIAYTWVHRDSRGCMLLN